MSRELSSAELALDRAEREALAAIQGLVEALAAVNGCDPLEVRAVGWEVDGDGTIHVHAKATKYVREGVAERR